MNNLDNLLTSWEDKEELEVRESLTLRPEVLLSPNVPKPLHGLAPRTIMGTKWWDVVRKESYKSTGFRCIACGVERYTEETFFKGQLHAHELYETYYEKRISVFKEVISLCECCHYGIHSGRTVSLFDKGIYDEQDCWTIFERKKQICGSYGEIDRRDYSKEWGDWRLGFEGKLYEPKFKSMNEWREYYK